ncbi:NUDIX domain-containing protein [Patescibacteria group bacterium]|nr:MAG: NUDIX domain-containing protein [Patescibacteria group bacterium]
MQKRKTSSGILLYRERAGELECLLVYPGGPFWKNKDDGAWGIPKGEIEENEDLLEAAKREFEEELGIQLPSETPLPLGSIEQKSGKVVYAWALKADLDLLKVRSNTFTLEWPPKSGKFQEFPEIDRAEFFDVETARRKINPAQIPFLERFLEIASK